MKIAVITVAGISSRFNENKDKKILKAIYFQQDPHKTLLFRQCQQCSNMDRIIVVGGYQYDELSNYILAEMPESLRDKILLVRNQRYNDLSSGYSLYIGLQEAFHICEAKDDEIVFLEGDLALDDMSLSSVIDVKADVLTYNREVIDSRKSVIFYEDENGRYQYLFNREHGMLQIDKPFIRMWNSGQVWKFTDVEKLELAAKEYFSHAISGTNLEIIQRYFNQLENRSIQVMPFLYWYNCNTREDWNYLNEHHFWRY